MADSHPHPPALRSPLASTAVTRATSLIEVFHPEGDAFAQLQAVPAAEVPQPYADLLAHNSHMTVAMEQFHGGPVSLRVVAEREMGADAGGRSYAREILLANGEGRIVQYGIVRMDLSPLPAASREAILNKTEPLGRILIASGMHREVQAVELLQVSPGPAFGQLMEAGEPCYGRVAEIRLDGRPAVELLEVVPAFSS